MDDRQAIVDAVANGVRAELARRRMPHQEAARRLGWKPAYIGRRMIGDTPFDAADLQQLARLLNVSVEVFFRNPRNAGKDTNVSVLNQSENGHSLRIMPTTWDDARSPHLSDSYGYLTLAA